MRLFALDQNFPLPIVQVLSQYLTEARLVPLAEIDERLIRDHEDWEILLALHNHHEPWDGLITTDSSMLSLPRELAVVCQTKLTLVVAEAAGHDPLKATGLVLTHLPNICKRTRRDKAQLWRLRSTGKPHEDPWDVLKEVGAKQGRPGRDLYKENRLSDEELAASPLAKPRK